MSVIKYLLVFALNIALAVYLTARLMIWWENSSLAKQVREDILALKKMLQKTSSKDLVGMEPELSWWDNVLQGFLKHLDRCRDKYKGAK